MSELPLSLSTPAVDVAVAAIVNGCGEVLITRRPDHAHQGGLWEFPGGKVEAGEEVRQALVREVEEELGLAVTAACPLTRIEYRYPDKYVRLHVWRVARWDGTPSGREGQPLRWVHTASLEPVQFPAANRGIIRALQLPDRYLITPQPDADPRAFLSALETALADGVRLVQLRAKASSPAEVRMLAGAALELCRAHRARLLINGPPEFAVTTGADGVHLDSARLMSLERRPLGPDAWVAASCHDRSEVEHACAIGVDFLVVSPVAATASHPRARPIGWAGFAALAARANVPVFALGGLAPRDLPLALQHCAQGIAAIRGLWKGHGTDA